MSARKKVSYSAKKHASRTLRTYKAPTGHYSGPRSLKYSFYMDGSTDVNSQLLLQTYMTDSAKAGILLQDDNIINLGSAAVQDTILQYLRNLNAHVKDKVGAMSATTLIKPFLSFNSVVLRAVNPSTHNYLPVVAYSVAKGTDSVALVPFQERCYLKLGVPNVGVNNAIYASWPTTLLVGNCIHLKITVYYSVIPVGSIV
jgi:hypothetical protein